MIYPIISNKRISTLKKQLHIPNEIEIDFIEANKNTLALQIGLDHNDKGPINNEGIDDLLSNIGLVFHPVDYLDDRYGKTTKYYQFNWKGNLWIGMGDNGYHRDWTRISIHWREKLTPHAQKEIDDKYTSLINDSTNLYLPLCSWI